MEALGITPTEFIGYLASLLVLASFLMKNMKKLRLLNTVGCAFFVAYGCILNFSIPIIITNAAIIIINVYYLTKKETVEPINNTEKN